MKKIIIDADSLAYHPNSVINHSEAIKWLEYKIELIKTKTRSTDLVFYLTKGKNIRHTIQPDYKANRQYTEKPRYMDDLKDYMRANYGAKSLDGYEADDIVVEKFKQNTNLHRIASADKDVLKNTPGTHLNLNTMEFISVTPEMARQHFYKQMILGDQTDNIPNLQINLGEKTLELIIEKSGLDIEDLTMYMILKKGINYKDRFRLFYCGVKMPNIVLRDVKLNKSISSFITTSREKSKISINKYR